MGGGGGGGVGGRGTWPKIRERGTWGPWFSEDGPAWLKVQGDWPGGVGEFGQKKRATSAFSPTRRRSSREGPCRRGLGAGRWDLRVKGGGGGEGWVVARDGRSEKRLVRWRGGRGHGVGVTLASCDDQKNKSFEKHKRLKIHYTNPE